MKIVQDHEVDIDVLISRKIQDFNLFRNVIWQHNYALLHKRWTPVRVISVT